MNIVLITGASSGMGRECAYLADDLYDNKIDEIWLISRRKERLIEVSENMKHKTYILPLDLTKESDLSILELELEMVKPNIKMLINASGCGYMGDFISADKDDQTKMVRLNCEALVATTKLCLPYISNNGRIIQFASSAAFVPQIGFSVYAASKAFVLSFSKSLNCELMDRNISVTAVCPGPVDTEFLSLAKNGKDDSNFAFKKLFISDPYDVVWKAFVDSYHRKSKSVYSLSMKLFELFCKIVPHDIILTLMRLLKNFGE
ncbi:MAG: SDR family NAD(P)-dependent oxidoreductase [Lachnospiraceae bacterium]|nr:SDR family NAD(P)-dependent oxidoreductase [Lachnospiraceae bacterium]